MPQQPGEASVRGRGHSEAPGGGERSSGGRGGRGGRRGGGPAGAAGPTGNGKNDNRDSSIQHGPRSGGSSGRRGGHSGRHSNGSAASNGHCAATAATAPAIGAGARRLRILALHGSRQTGAVFEARLKTLLKKLAPIADFEFIDAPHELPLAEGQALPMRCWWRHWALEDPTAIAADATATAADSAAAAGHGVAQRQGESAEEHAARVAQHHADVSQQLASGWAGRVEADWRASLSVLEAAWHARGPFDGVLGFSNGAAATFLFTCHLAAAGAAPRFAILAGGYPPEPLAQLIPATLLRDSTTAAAAAGVDPAQQPPAARLARLLPCASLHVASPGDPVIDVDDSMLLADCFQEAGRQVLLHDGGHCVPQQARHCATIADFLTGFTAASEAHACYHQQQKQEQQPKQKQQQAPKQVQASPPPIQQQQQQQPPSLPPKQQQQAAAGGIRRGGAPSDAVAPFDATEEQREEIEALEAIFMSEFTRISDRPPRFSIKLRQPGDGGDEEEEGADGSGGAAAGPPSRLFTLKVTLTPGYPGTTAPVVEVQGPLGANDPRRSALAEYLTAQCAEAVGGPGFVYTLVAAAQEWIDSNLPPDIGSRRGGEEQDGSSAAPGASSDAAASAAAEAAAAAAHGRWWEAEEADGDLIRAATEEAAAAQWAAWLGEGDEEDAGLEVEGTQQHAWDAAANSGQRGAWQYVVGLVGKPSAGKSSLFNALTDPDDARDEAKIGAYPFTTIDPNVGRGHALLPDPAPLLGLGLDTAKPQFGYAPGFDPFSAPPALSRVAPLLRMAEGFGPQGSVLWRRVPVTIKDVAGLVPGAYKGRGRGNAFLNDLCDADALIHVVDASGTTDSGGGAAQPGEGADPADDVRWVREEIHRWIFDNVRQKWPQVLRRPIKLMDLFSGYRAPRSLVTAVLSHLSIRPDALAAESAGVKGGGGPPGKEALPPGLQGAGVGSGAPTAGGRREGAAPNSVREWTEADLHRLVAHFLAARFPILLALNKFDLPSSRDHIPRVLAAHPHDAAVPVSAAAERALCTLRRAGLLEHPLGSGEARVIEPQVAAGDDAAQAAAKVEAARRKLESIQQGVLGPLGGTGASLALSCAVALRPPKLAFPVGDRDTLAALAAGPRAVRVGAAAAGTAGPARSGPTAGVPPDASSKPRREEGASAGVLRDCVLMRQGSRVEDVYEVLKRPPYCLLEGDLVRAEFCALPAAPPPGVRTAAAGGGGSGQDRNGQQAAAAAGSAGGGHAHSWRLARKDEPLAPANSVLLLLTNRRTAWQAAARQHPPGAG